jgi:hypothetical protein
MPGPHQTRISNTSSIPNRESCLCPSHGDTAPGCRSKRGHLEPSMSPRQPRSGRRRSAVAAANRRFAATTGTLFLLPRERR